jgi:hypothetical protein
MFFLAAAAGRAVSDGEREIAASDAAFDANELHASIQHARRAASAYAPYASHVLRGYERLTAIARGAEATGRPELAALAWQAQRAAALESTSFYQPFPDRLDEANRNLSRLAALAGANPSEATEMARRLLERSREQSATRGPWGALFAAGALIGAAGLVVLARRAVSPRGELVWARAQLGAALVLAGAACWAIAAIWA